MSADMETRRCLCGCPLTFRVWKGSPQRYAGRMCEASVIPGGMDTLYRRDVAALSKRKRGKRELPNGLIGTDSLSEEIGVSAWTIRQWTAAGKIPFERITPKLIGFRLESVRAAMTRSGLGRPMPPSDTNPEEVTQDVTEPLVSLPDDDEEEAECAEERDPELDALEEKSQPLPCPNPSCPMTSDDGSYCSDICARSAKVEATVSQSARPGPSTTTAPGEPSLRYWLEESSNSSDGENSPETRNKGPLKTPNERPTMKRTENEILPDSEIDGEPCQPKNESDLIESEPNEPEETPIAPRRLSSGISDAVRLMALIAPSGTSAEEKLRPKNSIDDCLQHLSELMKDVAKEDPRKRTSAEMINAVCNLTKNSRELMKLKLEIFQAATGSE